MTYRARSVRGGFADEDGLAFEGFELEPGSVVLAGHRGALYPPHAANGNEQAAEPDERCGLLRERPVRVEQEPCRSTQPEVVDQGVETRPRPWRIRDEHVGGENITADEAQCIALDDP